jgi:hypothetical protein
MLAMRKSMFWSMRRTLGMMSRYLLGGIRVGVTVAVVLLFCQCGNCEGVNREDFQGVKTLKEAVEVVKERLKQDGKPEYAALLSDERVRQATGTAVQSYEALLDEAETRNAGSKEYFQKEVKPAYLNVADKGEWPENCSFFSFYTLRDRRDGRDIAYDGLGLRLQVATPNAKFKAFALPIVDLYFGKFAGAGDF